ncbi:MAG TPA: hypothetical protein VD793_02645 [Gemmatimonadales bacterium]|nr:hypothetical protein [Gemmatimonadales bacterium]
MLGSCGEGPIEPLPAPFTAVVTGLLHSCGLVGDGAAYCWGHNEYGQLGDGSRRSRKAPVPVLGSLRFSGLSAGGGHTCGTTTSNDVYCWGFNFNGQLGDGSLSNRATPNQVSGGQKMVAVASGGSYSCGVSGAGAPFCWGWNQLGQLGDGTTFDRNIPAGLSGAPAFAQVSTGSFHTCGVTAAGQAYCWGQNTYGQLGDNSTADRLTPSLVAGGITFSSVDVGFQHSCGLATDGSGHCWGRNNYLQLGLGDAPPALDSVPRAVVDGHVFNSISAGTLFSCAVEQGSGAGYCWGYNASGQLGDNVPGRCQDEQGVEFQCAPSPYPVSGGLTFSSIHASNQHTCGLTTDGIAYCWGLGAYGQLGDGVDGEEHFTVQPVRVAGQP